MADLLSPALFAWAAGDADAGVSARELAGAGGVRRVILVEGVSDRAALLAVAALRGRDLPGDGVAIVAMGGATSIGRYLRMLGPDGLDVTVGGLCDAGEVGAFARQLEAAGFGAVRTHADLERLGFFICEADLEDELIRALGTDAVEGVIAAEGELEVFRTFQKQPHQRERSIEQQLHRFFGSVGGRKERYGAALAAALHPDAVPRPLDAVLTAPTRLA